jgi:hypothetical protein
MHIRLKARSSDFDPLSIRRRNLLIIACFDVVVMESLQSLSSARNQQTHLFKASLLRFLRQDKRLSLEVGNVDAIGCDVFIAFGIFGIDICMTVQTGRLLQLVILYLGGI